MIDLNSGAESGTAPLSRNQITDFVHGSDSIDLSTIDANPVVPGNYAFAFIGMMEFTGVGQCV